MTLCTQLPDLPPADGAERVFFVNALRHDWCHDDDLDDLHQAFQADAIPYTVQRRPGTQEPQWPDERDPREALLTAAARNPSLCPQ